MLRKRVFLFAGLIVSLLSFLVVSCGDGDMDEGAIPVVNITYPPNNFCTNSFSIEVRGTTSVAESYGIYGVEIDINDYGWRWVDGCTNNWQEWWQKINLASGTNKITVRASSDYGYSQNDPVVTVIYDDMPPTVSIAYPASWQSVGEKYSFMGTAFDYESGVSDVYVQVDGNSYVRASVNGKAWSYTVSLSVYGDHTNRVYAVDKAGFQSAVMTVIVSRVNIPYVMINSPANESTVSTSVITLSGTSGIDTPSVINSVEVQLNSGAWLVANGTNNWSYVLTLQDGANDIYVRAIGNNLTTNVSPLWRVYLE